MRSLLTSEKNRKVNNGKLSALCFVCVLVLGWDERASFLNSCLLLKDLLMIIATTSNIEEKLERIASLICRLPSTHSLILTNQLH